MFECIAKAFTTLAEIKAKKKSNFPSADDDEEEVSLADF